MLCLIKHENCYRQAFLGAAICFGILLAAITELLSLFTAISYISLIFCWGGILFIALIYLQRHWDSASLAPPKLGSPLILIGIAYILATTLLIALVYPPNNFDSMTYHMARVVQWIQNKSVAHFPTHITRQLYSSPWAEYAIMHLQILGGGDRFANLVQWFAMGGSIVGVSLIAGKLGAANRIQALAAVITATIPMGILQATSTQNDFVVAFWLVCFVYFGMLLVKSPTIISTIAFGGSLGLAILTKGTAYIFAFPFFVWLIVVGLTTNRSRFVKHILVAGLIAISLNAGHYWRNYALWGNPLTTDGETLTNGSISFKATLSNLTRNTASNTWTPINVINNLQFRGVVLMHEILGIDISDPATSFNEVTFYQGKVSMDEDYAGNGLHLLLAFMAVGTLALRRNSLPRPLLYYALSLAGGYLLFSVILKWQPWGTRLQLPLFVLASPIIAMALPIDRKRWVVPALAAFMLVCSTPWLLGNQTRPLYGERSIFRINRESIYFAKRPKLESYYSQAVEQFRTRDSCSNIGLLSSSGNAYEYPFWALLKNRTGSLPQIEHINVSNISGTIPLDNFKPCFIFELY